MCCSFLVLCFTLFVYICLALVLLLLGEALQYSDTCGLAYISFTIYVYVFLVVYVIVFDMYVYIRSGPERVAGWLKTPLERRLRAAGSW